jgi:hypothetical protein
MLAADWRPEFNQGVQSGFDVSDVANSIGRRAFGVPEIMEKPERQGS